MNILVLDEEFPWPLNTGKRIRSFNLMSRLATRHDMRYLAYGDTNTDSFRQFKQAGLGPIPVPPKVPVKSGAGFYARLGANLFSTLPYSVASHYSDAYREAIDRELSRNQPDVVVAEWTPYAIYLPEIRGPKKVIVAHNVETDIWRRYHDNEANPMKRWYIGLQADKMEAFERRAFTWCDGATAVSEHDAKTIRAFGDTCPIETIENGVDLEFFAPSRGSQITEPRLVFTGSMDWRPNQDAAHYFVREIMPLLKERQPDVEFTLVGRNPTDDIRQLGKLPRVNVTGTVDDVRPYIEESAVYVVPLRVGGGSRLKILEALALKMPVVSTKVGAEGLEITPNENILLGDTPEAFARQVDRVLKDRELALRLGEAGRKLVEARYGWSILADKLDSFIQAVASK